MASDEKLVDADNPETVANVLRHMHPNSAGLPRLIAILNESRKHFNEVFETGRARIAIDFTHQFVMIGSIAMGMMGDRYDAVKFTGLLCEKNRMYGDKPIKSWGIIGVIIRIDSKVQRLEHLQHQGLADTDDTIMDILGYAVLGYRLVQVTKGVK